MTTFFLVVLHILSVLFPAIGIGHAAYRKRKPVVEKAAYDRLRDKFAEARSAAETEGDHEEVARLTSEFEASLDRPDQRGRVLRKYRSNRFNHEYAANKQAYQEFRSDVTWVVLGLMLGGVANVWGTFA